MTGDTAQVHPIHIQFQGFLAGLFVISPGFGFRRVFELAIHAAITLACCTCFPSTVLAIGALAFWTFGHYPILAQFLATIRDRTASGPTIVEPRTAVHHTADPLVPGSRPLPNVPAQIANTFGGATRWKLAYQGGGGRLVALALKPLAPFIIVAQIFLFRPKLGAVQAAAVEVVPPGVFTPVQAARCLFIITPGKYPPSSPNTSSTSNHLSPAHTSLVASNRNQVPYRS